MKMTFKQQQRLVRYLRNLGFRQQHYEYGWRTFGMGWGGVWATVKFNNVISAAKFVVHLERQPGYADIIREFDTYDDLKVFLRRLPAEMVVVRLGVNCVSNS